MLFNLIEQSDVIVMNWNQWIEESNASKNSRMYW
jgi:hypothetical protein